MKKVLVYVEGQTEETFVRDLLSPHFWATCQMSLTPTLARTKRTKSGNTFKGGIVSYQQVKKDIRRLLADESALLVTTMMDYYGLPQDFPGKHGLSARTPYERVRQLEQAFAKDIDHPRFLPFLVLHEFEAFVFANLEKLGEVLPQYQQQVSALAANVGGGSPEEINEGKDTHPAARICQFFPGYRKRLHGPLAVQLIGLSTVRSRCPHFAEWVSKLESLCQEKG
jgi:hypothetical protein